MKDNRRVYSLSMKCHVLKQSKRSNRTQNKAMLRKKRKQKKQSKHSKKSKRSKQILQSYTSSQFVALLLLSHKNTTHVRSH